MEKSIFVKIYGRSKNLVDKLSRILVSFESIQFLDAKDSRKADLLIYELGLNHEEDLTEIALLVKSGSVEDVFITGEFPSAGVLMKAMRAGVKEFLSQPFNEAEVKDAFSRLIDKKNTNPKIAEKNGSIVSIFGSKGGVGTTTVAVNLAVSLSQEKIKNKVALLDMNTLFGEIPLFLEMAPKFHWGEITKNIERLDSQFLLNTLTPHKTGVQVLPSPAYLNGHVRPTPDTMRRLLSLMKQMFDYIIIDAGQSTDDTSIKVLEVSDMLMMITILSLPCLANTNKLMRSLTELGYVPKEKIYVVLNRYIKKGDISLSDAEAGIGKELYWVVPNDYDTSMSAINSGKPLLNVAPGAAITKSFIELAKSLNEPQERKAKKKWVF
jgi:pilus assembly protein CpaE